MQKLIAGLRQFQTHYFLDHQELFQKLSHEQHPRALFITCCDSRIDPNLLTNTEPGELFIIRNIGNIVPPYRADKGAEGAAIEYAVEALGVRQIIICGHSDCGAMKGLLHLREIKAAMPSVYAWLQHAEATRRVIQEHYQSYEGEALLNATIEENVLTQIENLQTYPVIHSKLRNGELVIYGWVYKIETGGVSIYSMDQHYKIQTEAELQEVPEPNMAATG